MNSKQRVYSALRFERPDRTPRFIWLGSETRRNLMKKYSVSSLDLDFKMGNDILQTWLSINGEMERPVPPGSSFVDEWGITWQQSGIYNAVVKHPLKDLTADEIADYPFPEPLKPERYDDLKQLLNTYGSEYFIGADISGSLFEPAYHLRGMENLMMDMAMEDPAADILLDKLTGFTTSVAFESVRLGVDWIWLGDDLGSQISMMMSPDMWRQYFKPRMKKIIDAIRAVKPDMIIAYHSCGSMSPVIPDLVEIGVNVLNPVQESAAGMNQRQIKAQYGDKLALMCGLDTQQFLVSATPEQVWEKTAGLIETLGANGGYIFAMSHHVQPDTPVENINAMLEALGNSVFE